MYLITLLLGVSVAQDTAARDPGLQRIRDALAAPPPALIAPAVADTRPTIRVTVEAWRPPPAFVIESDPGLHRFMRSRYPVYHHELLAAAAPRHPRSASIGFGIDVIPMIIALSREVSAQVTKVRHNRE